MDKPDKSDKAAGTVTDSSASGGDLGGQTLLPMLIGGLVLIILGMLLVVILT